MPGFIIGSTGQSPQTRLAPDVAQLQIVLRHLDVVTSTNDEARALAEAGAPEGTAVWADRQKSGRGRYGREWVSAAGLNVLLSIVLRPALAADRLGLITMVGATAVSDAIEEVAGIHPRIKWPNDVLIRGRKVSGMLLESAQGVRDRTRGRFVILGIGLNVNQTEFSPPLDRGATSLAIECGRTISRKTVVDVLTGHLERRYDSLVRDAGASLHASFVKRLTGLDQTVKLHFPGGHAPVVGRMMRIASDGGLELELPDGLRRVFHAGEVTLDPSV